MAKLVNVNVVHFGLSNESKPTLNVRNGSYFREMDTGDVYLFLDGTWYKLAEGVRYIKTVNQSAGSGLKTITTTASQIIAANSKRLKLMIQNNGVQPALLKFGGTPTITDYTITIPAGSDVRTGDGGYHREQEWGGLIEAIVETGTTILSVTELEL